MRTRATRVRRVLPDPPRAQFGKRRELGKRAHYVVKITVFFSLITINFTQD